MPRSSSKLSGDRSEAAANTAATSVKVENLTDCKSIESTELSRICDILEHTESNEALLHQLELNKLPFLFSSKDLLAILETTPSIKTKISIIIALAPRLTDPQVRSVEILDMFPYAEHKTQIEEALKHRTNTLASMKNWGNSTAASKRVSMCGRGGGRGPARMSIISPTVESANDIALAAIATTRPLESTSPLPAVVSAGTAESSATVDTSAAHKEAHSRRFSVKARPVTVKSIDEVTRAKVEAAIAEEERKKKDVLDAASKKAKVTNGNNNSKKTFGVAVAATRFRLSRTGRGMEVPLPNCDASNPTKTEALTISPTKSALSGCSPARTVVRVNSLKSYNSSPNFRELDSVDSLLRSERDTKGASGTKDISSVQNSHNNTTMNVSSARDKFNSTNSTTRIRASLIEEGALPSRETPSSPGEENNRSISPIWSSGEGGFVASTARSTMMTGEESPDRANRIAILSKVFSRGGTGRPIDMDASDGLTAISSTDPPSPGSASSGDSEAKRSSATILSKHISNVAILCRVFNNIKNAADTGAIATTKLTRTVTTPILTPNAYIKDPSLLSPVIEGAMEDPTPPRSSQSTEPRNFGSRQLSLRLLSSLPSYPHRSHDSDDDDSVDSADMPSPSGQGMTTFSMDDAKNDGLDIKNCRPWSADARAKTARQLIFPETEATITITRRGSQHEGGRTPRNRSLSHSEDGRIPRNKSLPPTPPLPTRPMGKWAIPRRSRNLPAKEHFKTPNYHAYTEIKPARYGSMQRASSYCSGPLKFSLEHAVPSFYNTLEPEGPVGKDDDGQPLFSYNELVRRNVCKNFGGLDNRELERYLVEDQFMERFGMSKTDFQQQAQWRRSSLKKALYLF